MSQNIGIKFMTILFKIQGYEAKDIIFEERRQKIIIEVERSPESEYSPCLYEHRRYDSTIQEILIGYCLGRAVYARLKVYRIKCDFCGIVTEKQEISEGKKRYSRAMELEVIRYTELMDNKSASKLLGLSVRTIYRIDFNGLERILKRYKEHIRGPVIMSVDEVSHKRRHKYATILTNYTDGRVIWVERGRKAEDLRRGYRKFGDSIKEIKTVTTDFWPAYEKVTREEIPNADIVFDRFHLSRILNRKVEEERRAYQHQLPEAERKQIKKNCRWLILKRRSNLSEEHLSYLDHLKIKNEPLYDLYLLKESFLEIFDAEKSREEGEKEILNWTEVVFSSNFKRLKAFARSVLKRLDVLLNWFDTPISNAKSEGVNNVIKTLLKRSYGFRNFDYFRLKVLQKCGYLMNYLSARV